MGSTAKTQGFTLIEVILFLTISVLLAVLIIAGLSGGMRAERYKDSVNSLKTFIQDQYSIAANVVNTRSVVGCPVLNPSDMSTRGTSSCVVLGRYITSADDTGTKLVAANIIARSSLPDNQLTSAALNTFTFASYYNVPASSISVLDIDNFEMNWGSGMVGSQKTPMLFTMAIIRLPQSGALTSYVKEGRLDIPTLIGDGSPTNTPITICVTPAAGTISPVVGSASLAVRINPYASSQAAVEIPLEGQTKGILCS